MGLAVSAESLAGATRQIVFDCDLGDFVDGGADEGVITLVDKLPAGWYARNWIAEVLTPFTGGASADARFRVGDGQADNNYTATSNGLSCDSAGDIPCGMIRSGLNWPNQRQLAEEIVVTVKIHGGDTDFTSLTAGKARVVLFCDVLPGY